MTLRTRTIAYWAFQIIGWGSYSLIGLFSASQALSGPQDHWDPVVTGFLLYTLYSIALTDVLHREGLRRQWFGGRAGPAWKPIFAAVGAVAAIQTFLIVSINVALEGRRSPFVDPVQVLFVALGTTAATTTWVFYYMLFTARRRRQERESHLQLALREAELRALEAQLSPHFLFNCLNSIRGLVVENPSQAQEMITRLADLLRHNLRHDLSHVVPLSVEVDAVADYLALESVRFEERLRVRFDIASEALPIQIPSMLLQTLVENAVKHGISRRPDGGELLVRARVESERLVLEVENTGGLGHAMPDATQVGLANARDRLRILYGGRAELDLTTREPQTVSARVCLPLTV